MKENIILTLSILLCISVAVYSFGNHPKLSIPVEHSCSITVERTSAYTATIHYESSNEGETFDMYMSVEYPDSEYTTEEQLRKEILYAIDQMQTMCQEKHYPHTLDTPMDDAQERAYNMDHKDCYTWQDIEIILFGETQE